MSKESILRILKTFYEFNNIEITHTFSLNEEPILTIRYIKNTNTIELTDLSDNTVQLFKNLEESADELQHLINKNVIV